ncbi:FUSC family protein [Paraburkholderia sp. BCC1886]|uniref:FUSC family protein n=1 Tax=Paraburkholderia sp. BCC1886 TaxID=2562670 RepID=UPI0011838EF3|nr:FUSC family protein [Paraburkholderia sp. BCC1886]
MKPAAHSTVMPTATSREGPYGVAGRESERLTAVVFAIRCAAAAALSYQLSRFFQLDEPVWAAMSALIVSQARFGETQLLSKGRILGSLFGIAVSVAVHASALVVHVPVVIQMAIAVGICAVLTQKLATLRVAVWTCPVVLLASTSSSAVMAIALNRGAEIISGVLVGLAMHWLSDRIPYRRGSQVPRR